MTNVVGFPRAKAGALLRNDAIRACEHLRADYTYGEVSIDFRHPALGGDWMAAVAIMTFRSGEASVFTSSPFSPGGPKALTLSGSDSLRVVDVEITSPPHALAADRTAQGVLMVNGEPWGPISYTHPLHAAPGRATGLMPYHGRVDLLRQRLALIGVRDPERAAVADHAHAQLQATIAELVESAAESPAELVRLLPEILMGTADLGAAIGYAAGLVEDDAVKGQGWEESQTFRTKRKIGGQKTGEANSRVADETWRGRGLALALQIRAEKPAISQPNLARELIGKLAAKGVGRLPQEEQVVSTIREWEREGKLPRSVQNGPRSKRG